jgi:TRAP-type C4-dicarboxylate transport system permease small subunit
MPARLIPARHGLHMGLVRRAAKWGLLEEAEMNAIRILALALIIGGALGLAYGGFSYTKENHSAKIGPIDINVKEKEHVNIPMWAGIGAIVIGGVLLLRRE